MQMQADRQVERRMDELATRAERTGIAQLTGFLSPAEQETAAICARRAGCAYFDCGGTEGAERRVVAFADSDWEAEWPVDCLRVTWHAKYGAPGHRDLLGSILGLGFGREKVGDLFIEDAVAYAFILKDMAGYIAANLESVGRTPVKVAVLDEWPELAAAQGEAVRATVASLRLDAVIAAAWKMSRGRAAEIIAAGRVQVNHVEALRPDMKLSEGAVLSVRGLGRAKIENVGGTTRKGRTGLVIARL